VKICEKEWSKWCVVYLSHDYRNNLSKILECQSFLIRHPSVHFLRTKTSKKIIHNSIGDKYEQKSGQSLILAHLLCYLFYTGINSGLKSRLVEPAGNKGNNVTEAKWNLYINCSSYVKYTCARRIRLLNNVDKLQLSEQRCMQWLLLRVMHYSPYTSSLLPLYKAPSKSSLWLVSSRFRSLSTALLDFFRKSLVPVATNWHRHHHHHH